MNDLENPKYEFMCGLMKFYLSENGHEVPSVKELYDFLQSEKVRQYILNKFPEIVREIPEKPKRTKCFHR